MCYPSISPKRAREYSTSILNELGPTVHSSTVYLVRQRDHRLPRHHVIQPLTRRRHHRWTRLSPTQPILFVPAPLLTLLARRPLSSSSKLDTGAFSTHTTFDPRGLQAVELYQRSRRLVSPHPVRGPVYSIAGSKDGGVYSRRKWQTWKREHQFGEAPRADLQSEVFGSSGRRLRTSVRRYAISSSLYRLRLPKRRDC